MFNVGDRIVNIDPRDSAGNNEGKYGRVTRISEGVVYVRYDDGSTGKSNKACKYYEIIEKAHTVSPCSNMSTKNPLAFFKRLALSKEDKLLQKTGLKDSSNQFTQEAIDVVVQILLEDNYDHLVSLAKKIASKKKECEEEDEDE